MAQDRIDFAAIKEAITWKRAIEYLDLETTQHGEQFRGPCPTCDTDNPRALVITPSKGFYCFGNKKGGDVVGLVAHCKGIGQKDAAELMLRDLMGNSAAPRNRSTDRTALPASRRTAIPSKRTQGERQPRQSDSHMEPLENLDPNHEDVAALGISAYDAEQIGAGYASRGVLRGLVAFPLRTDDGVLVAYVGVAEGRVGKIHWPEQKVVPLKRRAS